MKSAPIGSTFERNGSAVAVEDIKKNSTPSYLELAEDRLARRPDARSVAVQFEFQRLERRFRVGEPGHKFVQRTVVAVQRAQRGVQRSSSGVDAEIGQGAFFRTLP